MSRVVVRPNVYTQISEALEANSSTRRAIAQTGGGGASGGTAARAFRSASLDLAVAAWTKIPVDTISFDQGAQSAASDIATPLFDISTNYRYNVPSAGAYQVNGQISVLASAEGQFISAVYQSGFAAAIGTQVLSGNTAVNDILLCKPGDYLELWIFASVSAPLSIGLSTEFGPLESSSASSTNYLSVARVA